MVWIQRQSSDVVVHLVSKHQHVHATFIQETNAMIWKHTACNQVSVLTCPTLTILPFEYILKPIISIGLFRTVHSFPCPELDVSGAKCHQKKYNVPNQTDCSLIDHQWQGRNFQIAFVVSPPPQFCHWNVIQNEATVCFRTMRMPPRVRVGCLQSVSDWIIFVNYYDPPTLLKAKLRPCQEASIHGTHFCVCVQVEEKKTCCVSQLMFPERSRTLSYSTCFLLFFCPRLPG